MKQTNSANHPRNDDHSKVFSSSLHQFGVFYFGDIGRKCRNHRSIALFHIFGQAHNDEYDNRRFIKLLGQHPFGG